MSTSIKSKHAEVLNGLNEMSQSPYYATRKGIIVRAEQIIVEQEAELERLRAKLPESGALWVAHHNGQVAVGNSMMEMMRAAKNLRSDEEKRIAAERLMKVINEKIYLTFPDFESWWKNEVKNNGNIEIGADYRHWALKGWNGSMDDEKGESNG